MERQQELVPLFNALDREQESLERNKAFQEAKLERALAHCGFHLSSTAWKIAKMIFTITRNTGGILFWTNQEIADDGALSKMVNGVEKSISVKTVKRAISELLQRGIISSVTVKEKGRGTSYAERSINWRSINALDPPETAVSTAVPTAVPTAGTKRSHTYSSLNQESTTTGKAAADLVQKFKSVGLERAQALAIEFANRDEQEIIDVLDEYRGNACLKGRPGTIADRFRSGCWSVPGVRSAAQLHSDRERARARDAAKRLESAQTEASRQREADMARDHGPALDALTDDQYADAVTSLEPFVQQLFRRQGRCSTLVRELLLAKIVGSPTKPPPDRLSRHI